MALVRILNSKNLSLDSWSVDQYVGVPDQELATQEARAQEDIRKAQARLARLRQARADNRAFQAANGVIEL